MTIITILPHEKLCPQGAALDIAPGTSLCKAMLDHHIAIEHACELSCACTTCHVIVREGIASLPDALEKEEDMLDMAWGLTPLSRLSCQINVGSTPLTIEIPKYTINHARENNS
jgi:ferredoxin, 2Fe-2S